MSALALLAGAVLLGTAGVRRASLGLRGTEQVLAGLLAGWMGLTWLVYVIALAQGGLRAPTLHVLAAVLLLAGLLLAWRETRAVAWGAVLRADRALLLVLAVAAAVLGPLFWTRMLVTRDGAVWSGGNAWGDMAMHAALTASFAFADNVPPMNPLFPPAPLQYPFLPDFLTALVMVSGLELHTALVLTGLPLAVACVGLFFVLARRVGGSDGGALVASALLWLNGGLGFLYFLEEWRRSGLSLVVALGQLREDFCHMDDLGLFWSNLVTDVMLPQRAALVGMPATFLALALFARAWTLPPGRDVQRALLFAGVLVGALPRFHTHSYVAVGLVSGLLFLLKPSRQWVWFWVPAVALGMPQVLQVGGHAAASSFVHLRPGWVAGTEPQVLFWIRNVGFTLLLLPWAWRATPPPWRRFYLPFVVLQVLAAVVMLTPNDWDNIKLMYVWYALTCVLVGRWLHALAGRRLGLATLLLLACTASGLLALQHERSSRHVMFTADEVAVARWARENTGPRDVFAAAPSHLQPVVSLAGRPLVLGYTGWMWTHGYDYQPRFDDVTGIYAAGPRLDAVLTRHDVRWIYLGPREVGELNAEAALLLARFPVAFQAGGIRVLDARGVVGR